MVPLGAEDVVQLLRSEIERAGGPMAFSKKARVDRATVHRTLKRKERLSRKIISALDLSVVYVRNQVSRKDGLAGRLIVGDGTLQINGKAVRASPTQVALLACLCSEVGRVVPYERLCRVIGHEASHNRQMHILRQQMLAVRRMLTTHKARCLLAVSAGVGYALCEMAQG
jgi:DNA-binding response OmpR family regulator